MPTTLRRTSCRREGVAERVPDMPGGAPLQGTCGGKHGARSAACGSSRHSSNECESTKSERWNGPSNVEKDYATQSAKIGSRQQRCGRNRTYEKKSWDGSSDTTKTAEGYMEFCRSASACPYARPTTWIEAEEFYVAVVASW